MLASSAEVPIDAPIAATIAATRKSRLGLMVTSLHIQLAGNDGAHDMRAAVPSHHWRYWFASATFAAT